MCVCVEAPVKSQTPGFCADILQRLHLRVLHLQQSNQTDAAGALPAGRPTAPPAPLQRPQVNKTNTPAQVSKTITSPTVYPFVYLFTTSVFP